MKFFKKIFDFYINSSVHVGFSCFSLVQITFLMFHISSSTSIAWFAFFGTIVGYNFVKYDALARAKKAQMRNELKAITFLSIGSFFTAGYYFFQLQTITQLVAIAFLGITMLYTLPFFPNRRNARNWAGVKIYIVALCWVGVTLVLPILNAKIPITFDFYLICLRRFIFIFILILIFEIIDLQFDDPHLQTVPQQIGVKKTKILGYALLFIFGGLEFINCNVNFSSSALQLLLIFVIGIFLTFANEKRSKYYTSFWVESVPILWWLLLCLYEKWID
jgi:hypothetical protein